MEDPPKKFFRLAPGREVRLRYGYFVTCREAVKNAAGEVVELRCTYDPATRGGNAPPDGRKVQATLHWVAAADAVTAEVRLYSHLFTRPDPGADGDIMADLNPDSLEVLRDCLLEPALAAAPIGEAVQFERLGYFCADPDSAPGRPVFNRTVGLRDTWAKVQGAGQGRSRITAMHFGAAMFFTDASMTPGELGPLLEQRGFESLWVPEHSHIPLVRTKAFPGGTELPRPYYDIMDPFLVLTAAAVATKTLKVGTGVCLINQRDPIQTAKLVASLDQLSGGRFLFGVGNGWNKEEMEHHGTNLRNAPQAVARAHRGDEGDLVAGHRRVSRRIRQLRADADLAEAGAAAVSGHRRRRLPVRRAPRRALRRRLDPRRRAHAAWRYRRRPCRSSTRWRAKQGAIPPPCRSRCSAWRRTCDCYTVSRSRHRAGGDQPAGGEAGHDPADPRPLGAVDAAAAD